MTSVPPLLRCSGLRKRYGDRDVVDDVGFEIHEGETYGLLGPNGAGKTTAISMITGVLARDAGEVTVAGEPVDATSIRAKSLIGVVPQEIALYPDLSAVENLRFFGRLQGLGGRELGRRIDETLDIVGLRDRGHDRIDEYSGGMKRRANIAAGLLHRPRLLVLDEPTVGVDPQSRAAILDAVDELGGSGLSVLYTTHYMEEAERLCERIGILDRGQLVAEGTLAELVASIGENERIRVVVDGATEAYTRRLGELAGVVDVAALDGAVTLGVRDAQEVLGAVVDQAAAVGVHVTHLELVVPNLEEVFLHLTGRELRDAS